MKLTRLLCLMLSLVFVLVCFAACGGGDNTPVNSGTGAKDETGALDNPTHDANGFELDSLPELDFDNQQVHILTWFASFDEFCVSEEEASGVIAEAQYAQILRVEDRLNIDITFTQLAGREDDKENYLTDMETSNLSGKPYDIVSAYSCTGALAAMRGMLRNLSKVNYINFDKPWWPADLQNSVAINGNLYFASGDISPNLIYGLFSIITNMDLWEKYYGTEYGSNYLYELVDEKEWTLDALLEFSKGLYVDINNNGKDDSDQFGFVFANEVSIDPFLQGSGIDITTINSSGKIVMADSFFSQQMSNVVDKLTAFYREDYVTVPKTYGGIFPEGRSLFIVIPISLCVSRLAATEMSYAALPMPLYDENQKDYVTTMNHNFSMFGILTNVDAEKTDCAAATLEALASEAYRTVSPAIFEQGFRLRYSANSDVSRMFAYIRDSLKFDMGRLYRLNFSTQPTDMFRKSIRDNFSWGSIASNKTLWNKTLTKISEAILALAENQ